jgi:hypothetical protein
MLIDRLEVRDLEVLRTLARLRYVPKQQLRQAFFPSDDSARKRLKKLAALDLIRTHTKGLPERLGYFAWRLAPLGIETIGVAFPDEPVPEGLADSLAEGSLLNLHHREALQRLYLDFVAGPTDPVPAEVARAAVTERAARVRARAAQIFWQPDGDVQLRHKVLKPKHAGQLPVWQDEQVVPDATVSARYRRTRVFVELDRSTHRHQRVVDSLKRYRRYVEGRYAADYTDGRAAHVLLVTSTAARAAALAKAADAVLGAAVPHYVGTADQALLWMRAQLVDETRLARATTSPPEPTASRADVLEPLARELYLSLQAYREHLRRSGAELPDDVLRPLRSIREALNQQKEVRHAG